MNETKRKTNQLRFYYTNQHEPNVMLVIISRSNWGAEDKLKFLVGEDKADEWEKVKTEAQE